MRIKKNFVKRKIGDKYLVVSVGNNNGESMFIEMNDTSSEIWDLIDRGLTAEEIAEKLVKKYSIAPEKALEDTNRLISSMQKAGIFEEE